MAEVLKKQRKSNFSQEEIEMIVRAVSENYDTLYGEFSKRAVNKNARHRAWLDVTKEVNLVSSEKRTLQEVKNKWKKCQHLYRADDYFSSFNSFNDDVFDVTNVWEPLTEIEDEDSMPLEQRLKSPVLQEATTEPVLQSQSLSPTKLKVTRQAKPSQPSPKPPTPPPPPPPIEEICLKWNSHHSNMQNSFPSLLLREQYVDATLVSEGQTLKCHRVILSSCSPYFEQILASISPYQHPVLFMKDVPFWILKSLCDFMYAGEVHILQTKLEELLAVAETLKIKGLAGQIETKNEEVKQEPPKLIKEEIKEKEDKEIKKKEEKEIKKKEEKEIKRKEEKEIKKKEEKEIRKKDEKETRKKDEKEIKKKEEKEMKLPEIKQPKRKEEKDVKKKEEKDIKKKEENKEKKRLPPAFPLEMPVLKSLKSAKFPLEQTEMPILRFSKTSRSSGSSRRAERKIVEKEKIIEKPLPAKEITTRSSKEYLDPLLDLLEPVYEEVAKDPKPTKAPVPKDPKIVTVRRNLQKKIKKRKILDEREESPPPVLTRKGTRSRPSRKVPKYFHPPDDQSTIVREPHTDPLMHLQCIKSEPLFAEDSIEIEDNLVGFSESSVSVEEELIGSYEQSSFGRYSRRTTRSSQKELPIIMDVHSITSQKEETPLNIINLRDPKLIDPLEDPLTINQGTLDIPAIVEAVDNTLGFRISQVITEKEEEICTDMGFQITNIVSEQEISSKKLEETEEEEESVFTEFEATATQEKNIVEECKTTEMMDTSEDVKTSTSFQVNKIQYSNKVISNFQPSGDEFVETGTQNRFEDKMEFKSTVVKLEDEEAFPEIQNTVDKGSVEATNFNSTLEFAQNDVIQEDDPMERVSGETNELTENTKEINEKESFNENQDKAIDISVNTQETDDINKIEEELLQDNNDISDNINPLMDNEENILNDDCMPKDSSLNVPDKEFEVVPKDESNLEDNKIILPNENFNVLSGNHTEDGSSLEVPNGQYSPKKNVINEDNIVQEEEYVSEEKNSKKNYNSEDGSNLELSNEQYSQKTNIINEDNIVQEEYIPEEKNYNSEDGSNLELSNEQYSREKNIINEDNIVQEECVSEEKFSNKNYNSDSCSSNVPLEEVIIEKNDIDGLNKIYDPSYAPDESSSNVPNEQDSCIPDECDYIPKNLDELIIETSVEKLNLTETNTQKEETGTLNLPGFHIAKVVNEQIAEIEGNRVFEDFTNDSEAKNESCNNELESIVNDLSKIVGDTCGESSLGSGSMDDTNSMADSLENLLQK